MYNIELLNDFYNDNDLKVEVSKVSDEYGNFKHNTVSVEDVDEGCMVTFKGTESQFDLKIKCLNALYHQRELFSKLKK